MHFVFPGRSLHSDQQLLIISCSSFSSFSVRALQRRGSFPGVFSGGLSLSCAPHSALTQQHKELTGCNSGNRTKIKKTCGTEQHTNTHLRTSIQDRPSSLQAVKGRGCWRSSCKRSSPSPSEGLLWGPGRSTSTPAGATAAGRGCKSFSYKAMQKIPVHSPKSSTLVWIRKQ